MAYGIFKPSGKLFLSILMALGIVCFSVPSLAQNVVAGCSANVWNALTAKANAQVAYDVAVTRTMVNRPDSVLNITCFPQAAGVSASMGGAIFSGNFTPQLETVYPGVTATSTYNCTAIGDMWNTIATGGINTNAPYVTFEDLLNGTPPPGGGGDFPQVWSAAQAANIFSNLKTAVAALPQPPQALDFSGAKSSCDVLKTAGIIQDSLPVRGILPGNVPMKRIFLFALLIFTAIGLPVTAVQAQQSLDPGCSQEFWGYLQDQASAVRARNKAYEREILHRQQSTLYLTCFDQAMALSAKLGLIFSDNIFPNPPPADTLVFPNVMYPDWGEASQPTLAMDLNTVVNPVFNNWLSAPVASPALFNFLPQWMPSSNQLTGLIVPEPNATTATTEQQVMQEIISFLGTDASTAAQYMTEVNAIDQLVKSLPTIPLQSLPPEDTQYTELLQQLMTTSTTIQGERASGLEPLLAQLSGIVSGFNDTCARADEMWVTLDPAYKTTDPGVFYPPEGQYYPFTPYYTLKDFLTNNSPTGATPDYVQELGDATDSAALKQALSDLTGPLSSVGQSQLWPSPPTFSVPQGKDPPSAQDVIQQM